MNPAECCMSLLNLGLQNVSLSHASMDDEHEELIKDCHSVADVRRVAEKAASLRPAYASSMEGVVSAVDSCFEQLQLKDVPVVTKSAALNAEIDEMFSCVKKIDTTLSMGNRLRLIC